MVLAELGGKISVALRSLHSATVIDEEALDAVLKQISMALLQADVNIHTVRGLRDNVKRSVNLEDMGSGVSRRRAVERAVVNELVGMLSSEREPFKPRKGQPNVVMFVGLQGSGKTTTIAKYALHFKRKGWKTCMVCADTFRAGAFDQLKQNATRIRVPFYGSYTESDPVKIAAEGVEQFRRDKYEVIIVDTSGRHKQETALFEEMQQVSEVVSPDDIVFVMDSTIGQAAVDQARAFRDAVPIGSVVISKLDGNAKGGGALSAVAATGSPIVYIGTGEHPEDFEEFEARSFVRRLLGMGDIGKFVEEIKEKGILEGQEELMKHVQEGRFTLRDMYDQFRNLMKLGPLGRMMSMLPGLPPGIIPKGQEKEGTKRLQRFMYMMDSMTDEELDGEVALDDSRMMRVAHGSGTFPQEVQALINTHKQMAKMVNRMGKSKMLRSDSALSQQISRNPQNVMRTLAKSMNPRMLQQLGGAGNMMKLMQKVGSMDGDALAGLMGGMGGMPGAAGGGGGGAGGGGRR